MMLGEPKQRPNEAEGDFLRRRGRFFFSLSLIAGILCVVTAFAARASLPALDMRAFLFGVMTLMLAAVCLLAVAGALRSMIESLARPRVRSVKMDRMLYGVAIVIALALGGAMAHLTIDGFVTGQVVARRGKVSRADAPEAYWLLEAFWLFGTVVAFRGAFKFQRQMSSDKLAAPNPAVNTDAAR